MWEEPADRDRVVLTTFHRAKGLQWPTVIVAGLGAGLMPIAAAQTPAAIDEERRLFYVALTRSEEELWCSWFERTDDDAGQGGPPRGPSPWLAPVERTIARAREGGGPDGGGGGLGPGGRAPGAAGRGGGTHRLRPLAGSRGGTGQRRSCQHDLRGEVASLPGPIRQERLAAGGGRGRRRHGVSRRAAATLEGVACSRGADRRRRRTRARLHRGRPPHRVGVPGVRRLPRVRHRAGDPAAAAASRVAARGRIRHGGALGAHGTADVRVYREDQPQRLLRPFRPPTGHGADGVPGRREPARSIITRPGARLLHAPAGRWCAGRYRPPRSVLRGVAIRRGGQRHRRGPEADRAAAVLEGGRHRGRRIRVPDRNLPHL